MSLVVGSANFETSPIFGVSFLVLATKIMRPGHVYRLVVTNYSPQIVTAQASILRDGVDLASVEQQCSTGVPETLMLRVPSQALEGLYKLKVEGRTESDEVVFSNETALEFSLRSITILVQTDKPIYQQSQIVKFRTVPITTDLKPFSDAIDVFMLDPNGIVVKKWLSKQTNLGSVSIEYPLSERPVIGNWTIRVFAQGQTQDSHFLVETYYPQQYEVKVTMPNEFLETDEFIKGSISANFTNGAPVSGNLSVVISGEIGGYTASKTESESQFNGFTEFRYKMQDLKRLLGNRLENARVTVTAYVGERYIDSSQVGYAKSVIASSRIKLAFIGQSVFIFKPYMTFDAYLAVSHFGGMPLPTDQLKSSLIDVRLIAVNKFGSISLPNRTLEVSSTSPGIWKITIDARTYISKQTLNDLDYLKIDAIFYDKFVSRASVSGRAYPAYSPTLRSLQVTTSTSEAKVGDYAIFHIASNYKIDILSYLVVTKGLILTAGRERVKSSPTTFAVPISAEMVPTSTIVVYDITKTDEIIVDTLTFHVDGTSLHNFTVILNPNKDKHGETLEVAVYGQPGTYVGLSAFNKDLYAISNAGQLNRFEFDRQMEEFDRHRNTATHQWLTDDGKIKDVIHFPSTAHGVDTFALLENSGLIALTDGKISRRSQVACSQQLTRCLIVDKCLNASLTRCNGFDDCGDNSDESGCDLADLAAVRSQERLYRANRLQRIYEDNWLWRDINIGPLGHYIFTVKLPSVISTWSVNAFSMNPLYGIGMLQAPLEVSNIRPFLLRVEMPSVCNHGEQIGIRALITNYLSKEIEVDVVLASSPDYKFVRVGSSGEVSSYSPDTTFGEHQHLITVKSGETIPVYLPIVAQRLGDVNVTVSAVTQVAKRVISKVVRVDADGVPQIMHTAIVVDLSQGSYLIKHLDTNVTESPEVKYDKVRRYIYGSNRAMISVSGGVVGPIFPTLPIDSNVTLRLPSDCGEQNMFNFAMNLLSISYLRQTGQETVEAKKEVFKHLNILYQKQLSFRRKDGSFNVFRTSAEPSIWLTSFVARYLHQATAQEWENYIYIDPDVIDSAIGWLVSKQTSDGAFVEQGPFAYDRKLESSQNLGGVLVEDFRLKNVSLTAYVLIALHSVKDRAGEQAARANNARILAQRYLESMLYRTTIKTSQDPFNLALVTYALQLVNSIEADEAYSYLEKRMHIRSGLRYWSAEPVAAQNQINTQNNRNLIYPRARGNFDARNVQTTAYALLTQIQRQAPSQRDIVEWLNTQRLSNSGWSSTQDTIVALQSLIEYSINSDHRSVTDIKISIETPALRGSNRENKIFIQEANISQAYTLNIPNAHGIFTVRAEGSGTALLSLDIQYNVDWPHLQIKPAIKAFELDIKPSYSGRNSSNMHMDICARWTLLSEAPRSGMTVLEVPVPTGYVISQSALDRIINASAISTFSYPRNLREARATERRIYFYFDYVDDKRTCVQFTMNRWYPVANMTRFMPVKIYDYYAPERFNETMLNAYNLHALSICHVCGSYQCPYCPIFSFAYRVSAFSITSCLLVALSCIITFLGTTGTRPIYTQLRVD